MPPPALPHDGTHEQCSPSQGPGLTALTPALPSAHRSEPSPTPTPHAPAQASSSDSQLHPASKRLFLTCLQVDCTQ